MENIIRGGLNEEPEDKNDIDLGKITIYPELSELPETFSLGDTPIHHQANDGNDDFCGSYGGVGIAYLQDGVEGSQAWVFAAAKDIAGNPESFGLDMRTIFKVWVKYGSPRKEDVVVPEKPNDRRYLKNYDSNLSGDELKKKTFVTCKGPYDAFDNIRASIWKYREEKRAVGIGLIYSWSLTQLYLTGTSQGGFGHFMFCGGWKEDWLEVTNSYGYEAGKDGKHWLSRETINYYVGKYGAKMLIDMPLEDARAKQLDFLKKLHWPYDFLGNIWDAIKEQWQKLTKQS